MTTSTTDAEAIARVIDPDAMVATTYIDDIGGRPLLTPSMSRRKEDALGKANRILSYLASRREAIANDDIADALERCDWSGAPIGNKAIIASAIERLRENVLFCEDAADHLALIDYISDKIGLPKDEELSRETFSAWLSASRREAQEPVAWLRDVDGTGSLHPASKGDPGAFPVYTAPPAPAGEVERLVKPIIDRLEWNGRLQQWVVRPDLPAGTINAVRVALNGGRSE